MTKGVKSQVVVQG